MVLDVRDPLLAAGRKNRKVPFVARPVRDGQRRKAHEWGQGLVRSGPDAAGSSLWEALAEPRVLGTATCGLTDSTPAALCQEGASGSLALLDGQKS